MMRFIFFILLITFSNTLLAAVPVQQWKTPKKIQTLFVADNSTDLVSVNFSFKGAGSRTDPQGKEGLTSLMLQLLFERTTEGSTRYDLQKKLKSLGVLHNFQYEVDLDNIAFRFKCPKENLKAVFDIFKIFIKTPTFDQKELAKMKNFDPNNSRLSTAGEQQFASKILIQNFFAPSPYANPAAGTLEGRQSITLNEIKQALQDRLARDRLVFSIVGNVNPKELSTYIDNTFGELPEKANLPVVPEVPTNANGEVMILPKDSAQSGVVFGQPGIPRTDKRFLSLVILNDILGGRPFTSRLWLTIREQQGLVYSIDTNIFNLDRASLLLGSFESSNTTVKEVIDLIKTEWITTKENGVTEAEFNASKTGLRGRFALNFTSPGGIARYILYSYLDGLPFDYINQRNEFLDSVTLNDVNELAKSLLDPEKLTFVVVGNPS